MSLKAKYVLYTLLDFALTFGGTGAIIVYNYITPGNSLGYKLSFGGIVLVVALLLSCKTIFQKTYRRKFDNLLQSLALASTDADKQAISKKINELKRKNDVYDRLTMLLPFAILYVVTWLGSVQLKELNSTVGLILASMGGGSVFNVLKKPVAEEIQVQKITKK